MSIISRFIANEPDDRHCFQASYAMVLESISKSHISMRQAEVETGFEINKSTWTFKGMNSFANKGYKVSYIDRFDIDSFISDPKKILTDLYGKDIADRMERRSNMRKLKSEIIEWKENPLVVFENRSPTIDDIKNFIARGCYVIASVNYFKLLGKQGYNGHSVVVYDISNTHIFLQNPGLPPIKNQKCSIETFKGAWMYPDERGASLIAIAP